MAAFANGGSAEQVGAQLLNALAPALAPGDLIDRLYLHVLDRQPTMEERAGLLEAAGVVEDALTFGVVLTARLVAAKLVDALRGQTEVSHDRDARVDEPAHGGGERRPAFQLDGFGEAFLQQSTAVAQGVFTFPSRSIPQTEAFSRRTRPSLPWPAKVRDSPIAAS